MPVSVSYAKKFFFSSRRRHTRCLSDWSSDVCSSDLTTHPKIWLAPAGGGSSRLAADGIDLIPTALRWAEGGNALYFETGMKGTSQLVRVDLKARRAAPMTSGDRTVHLMDVNERTGGIAYAVNDP